MRFKLLQRKTVCIFQVLVSSLIFHHTIDIFYMCKLIVRPYLGLLSYHRPMAIQVLYLWENFTLPFTYIHKYKGLKVPENMEHRYDDKILEKNCAVSTLFSKLDHFCVVNNFPK
jgi:hypothetical protein